jgi:hypothetical protein
MAPTTTMMFEAEDLEEASPATVSRVGMVYLDAKRLGNAPLVTSFLRRSRYTPEMVDHIQHLCDWLLPPLLFWVEKSCTFSLNISDLQFAVSILRLFDALCVDAEPCLDGYEASYRAPTQKRSAHASTKSFKSSQASGKSGKNMGIDKATAVPEQPTTAAADVTSDGLAPVDDVGAEVAPGTQADGSSPRSTDEQQVPAPEQVMNDE